MPVVHISFFSFLRVCFVDLQPFIIIAAVCNMYV